MKKTDGDAIQLELKIVYAVLVFIVNIIWWIILALLVKSVGKHLGTYFERKEIPWQFSILPFSLLSIGLIVTGIVEMLKNIVETDKNFLTVEIFLLFVAGIFIFFVGKSFYDYFEKTYEPKPQEKLGWQK